MSMCLSLAQMAISTLDGMMHPDRTLIPQQARGALNQ